MKPSTGKYLIRTLFGTLLLVAAASSAQQRADDGTADSQTPTITEQGPPATDKPQAAEAAATQAAEPAQPTAAEVFEDKPAPPSKYRASEQISDDLSVSFPVDI